MTDLEASIDLIRLAQDGDAQALDRLITRYLPRLQRWATGRLPATARGMVETQDLVQDALIRTVTNLKDFTNRGEGALQAYLRQAVLNRLRDEIRRHAVRPGRAELGAEMPDNGPSPLEVTMGREIFARYEAALATLEPLDREGVIARVELGLSYQEIAALVEKPTADAARMSVARSLQRLALLMANSRL
jgi:RNA polymerase sigma-70 factor (ECF subfamily)